jgi:hypothetical protein
MEYRCTFPARYPMGSPGYSDPTARQGYYVDAANSDDAARLARAYYGPGEREVDVQRSTTGSTIHVNLPAPWPYDRDVRGGHDCLSHEWTDGYCAVCHEKCAHDWRPFASPARHVCAVCDKVQR